MTGLRLLGFREADQSQNQPREHKEGKRRPGRAYGDAPARPRRPEPPPESRHHVGRTEPVPSPPNRRAAPAGCAGRRSRLRARNLINRFGRRRLDRVVQRR